MSSHSPKRALVLSGGGARGAYEAGTIRYIMEVLPDSLGKRPRFDIICGTSVGAINAAWLAATLDDPGHCVRHLERHWRSLVFSDVVQFSYREIWRLVRKTVLEHWLPGPLSELPEGRDGGFLETAFFDRIISREIPFDNISKNLEAGLLDAVSVSATEIVTGRTVVFVDSAGDLPPWTRDARRIAIGGCLNAQKVLASAAIPLVFPAVPIDGHWYSDGGLRQNTPISPALRLGADRVLVVALKSRSFEEKIGPLADNPPKKESHPSPPFIVGKVLDALLLDPLDYDLDVLERVNAILEHGEEAFGDESFVDQLNEVIRSHRGQGYRVVKPVLLRPGRDLGRLAAKFAGDQPDDFWGSLPLRLMARRALDADGAHESDFLSYLLFDGGYTGQLIEMGYQDASERHDELVEFFSD